MTEEIAELEQKLASGGSLRARATVSNPCDCDEGEPLWSYPVSRKSFSFAGLEGNVEKFDLRCANERLQGSVEPGKQWMVPENARHCRILVFGEDGATFEFVEST